MIIIYPIILRWVYSLYPTLGMLLLHSFTILGGGKKTSAVLLSLGLDDWKVKPPRLRVELERVWQLEGEPTVSQAAPRHYK
jgi:hypothetical protein